MNCHLRKMDMSVGSAFKNSANLPRTVVGDSRAEHDKVSDSSDGSLIQNYASSGAPASSTARFKVRSAKERQQSLGPTSIIKQKSMDKKDVFMDQPNSFPDPDKVDKRKHNALELISKDSELQINSKTEGRLKNSDESGPGFVESMTNDVRGRTERRGASFCNRSKSLDWREEGNARRNENQTAVIRRTTGIKVRSISRSESIESNSTFNSPSTAAKDSLSSSLSLRIHGFNRDGTGKQESSGIVSSEASGSSLRMGRVTAAVERASSGQSLPSRIKLKQGHASIEERKNPWHYGQGGPKLDQEEQQLRSWASGSKLNEVTGNQTILDRIERLYRLNGADNNTETNSKDSLRAKRNSAPVDDWFSRSDSVDSNSSQKSINDSPCTSSPPSSASHWRSSPYDAEKGGTFPRRSSKGEVYNSSFNPSVSPNKNSRRAILSSMSSFPEQTCFKKSPSSTDSKNLQTSNSESVGGTFSRTLRTESSHAPVHSNIYGNTGHSTNMQENTMKESERGRQEEKPFDNLSHTKVTGEIPRPRPQLSRSITIDCGNYKEDEALDRKTREGLLEKYQVPSIDSVRNTIHKFEALAQQSQTPSEFSRPRRALSVAEKSKPAVGLNKSNSEKSLSGWKGFRKEGIHEDFFGKSDVREEIVNTTDGSNHSQAKTTNKIRSTIKIQSRVSPRQELEGAQALKTLDQLPSNHRKEAKDSYKDDFKAEAIKRIDEPDSKASLRKLNSIESSEETVGNNLSAAVSQASSSKLNGKTDVFHPEVMELSLSLSDNRALLDSSDNTPSNSPGRIPLKGSLQTYSRITDDKAGNPVLQDPPTLGTSTLSTSTNSTSAKAPSISLSDSTVCTPVQVVDPYKHRRRDEKVNAKVSRWITDKGDDFTADDKDEGGNDVDAYDDEDEEGTERDDDSDSGESSITITSNMSQSDHRSFSVSFVDLCNLGGLDCPLSDNAGKSEERWMSRRSASLSSDISVLSSVTLLGTEELDTLLDDVRSLGDDALENYEDVQVVVLHKEEGSGLGFTLAGGVDQNKPVTVHRVFPCGAAAQEGSIQEGDQVLSINGTALHNSAHWEALRTLRKARGRGMAVVVVKRGNIIEMQHSGKDSPTTPTEKPADSTVRVTLTKSSSDLGFSLEGGVGSSLGDKPLTIQKLFQGGPFGKVFPGDELLELQGQNLGGLRRLEAWNMIKRLPSGPVELLLNRPHQPH